MSQQRVGKAALALAGESDGDDRRSAEPDWNATVGMFQNRAEFG